MYLSVKLYWYHRFYPKVRFYTMSCNNRQSKSDKQVSTFRFLGTRFLKNLTRTSKNLHWTARKDTTEFSQENIVKVGLPQKVLSTFYCCTTESLLANCITVWCLRSKLALSVRTLYKMRRSPPVKACVSVYSSEMRTWSISISILLVMIKEEKTIYQTMQMHVILKQGISPEMIRQTKPFYLVNQDLFRWKYIYIIILNSFSCLS